MDMVLTLILLPILASILLLMLPNQRAQYVVITAVLFFLGLGAFSLYTSMGVLTFQFSHTMNLAIIAADVVLLLFFSIKVESLSTPK